MKSKAGERLAEARIAAKLTQKQLADLIGVTSQTIANWEASRSVPRITLRESLRLITALPITLDIAAEISDEIEEIVKAKKEGKE